MHKCVYCGRENEDSSAACAMCGTPFGAEPPETLSDSMRRNVIAAVGAMICFGAYVLWAGGQPRYNHWIEGILWGIGGAVGVGCAFMGWRLAKHRRERLLAAGLLCFHGLSLLLLLLMISLIGARP